MTHAAKLALTIRTAQPADAAPLAGLARRVFAATYGVALPNAVLRDYLDERFSAATLLDEIYHSAALLVATAGENLAGYARLVESPPHPALADPAATELAQLYIDAPCQGQGVGDALLAAACAATAGSLWLCAWAQNQRALRFYTRRGFAPVGRTEVYVHNIVFHDLVLARPTAQPTEAFHDR